MGPGQLVAGLSARETMRGRAKARLGILIVGWMLSGCTGTVTTGPGWTSEPIGSLAPVAPGVPGPSETSRAAPSTAAGPSSPPSPATNAQSPTPTSAAESSGLATVAFSNRKLPSIDLSFACQWVSPVEVGNLSIAGSASLVGDQVMFFIEPRANRFEIWRENAANYMARPGLGSTALSAVGPGWASGSMWFEGLAPDPYPGPGPLRTSIEEWVRPIGGNPSLNRISGTTIWACEPAPPDIPTPGPVGSDEPRSTVPPLPGLTLVSGGVRRDAVSGCGGFISIGGYQAADSCGPSFKALDVDYAVRVPEGGTLRFELPVGWRFEQWSLGWVTQFEAERWHGEQPDTFELIQTGGTTNGRLLELDTPPIGDWTVRLDWIGARGADRFGMPAYFRVLVKG